MERIHDPPMKLLVAGGLGWIGTHIVVNIGAMIGIFPLTGVTLPLLSFGGTSLLFIMLALGLIFQISRYTTHGSSKEGDNDEDTRGRRGVGRTRNASGRRHQGAS
jgi:cell division protein FtsW